MSDLDRIKGLGIVVGIDDGSLPGTNEGNFSYSGECKGTDQTLDNWYKGGAINDDLDRVILEVDREVEQMRHLGKLSAFVEGEAIGACPRRLRQRPVTLLQARRTHNRWMEDRRAEMLELRRKNDETIASLLERKF